MKLIIAGSRDIFVREALIKQLVDYFKLDVTEVVSGKCTGVDAAGEYYADGNHLDVKGFPYESEKGRAGGPSRNKKMAKYADALLLIWNGKSRGSANMKEEMQKLKKPIYEVILRVNT